MPKDKRFIVFDIEGPLTPEDNAYELMQLLPQGQHLFEVLSRYDDMLTLEDKENYQPGNTLALIAPFLIRYGISGRHMVEEAGNAPFTPGAQELVDSLQEAGWQIFCISTAYSPFALTFTMRLGIDPQRVASTFFPTTEDLPSLSKEDVRLIDDFMQDITSISVESIPAARHRLEHFFADELAQSALGDIVRAVEPVGGRRKKEALNGFARHHHSKLDSWVVVGDSITDVDMLQAVDQAGGLAVAFNANEYALPHATLALAAGSITPLGQVLSHWVEGDREAVRQITQEQESLGPGAAFHMSWIAQERDTKDIIRLSQYYRRLLRSQAGDLG